MALKDQLRALSARLQQPSARLRASFGGGSRPADPTAAEPMEIDGYAFLKAAEAAGPEGSSHRLIEIVQTYEALKGKVDPAKWHTLPGLQAFVRQTGEYIPMIPPAILARMRETVNTPATPRKFLPDWADQQYLVDPMTLDAAALFETIALDGDSAEQYRARNATPEDTFFLRYALFHHSLEIARALPAERVVDFGSTSPDFARLLTRALPDAEICMVDDSHADGLTEREDRIYRLGAPVTDLGLFEDESVDLVVAHNRFERLAGNQDQQAMGEIDRVLVRGGRFLIAPFSVADRHALTVSPFSCFIANGETDYAALIEAEMASEDARVDFNISVVAPISRRYDLASARRRLLEPAPNLSARLRTFAFSDSGFDDSGRYSETLHGMKLRRSLFDKRAVLALEFIKH
ncbi:MAG: methyltransferase domain-containing protein [Pseudomonadota bacterium]